LKLATLANGTRDGELVVVSRDQKSCAAAPAVARTLQDAVDHWSRIEPQLRAVSQSLESGTAAGAQPFDATRALAPLPRAYQWMDASGYLTHIERVRKARGAALPPGLKDEPIIYQGLSDRNLAWNAPLQAGPGWGADFEAELAVIVDDVPQGVARAEAGRHILLVVLLNDISLRELIPGELAKGFGFFQSKPASAFAPIAVTPDEFGLAWDGHSLALDLDVQRNGKTVGRLRTGGTEQHFGFPAIIEYAARTRAIGAGSIVGAGTVSNADCQRGAACIAELRILEQLSGSEGRTPWLEPGDTVQICAHDAQGQTPFGVIRQPVTAP
jgi:fumarylacetoacetate (FAA) hydrolase